MRITYKFVTGETKDVETTEELAREIKQLEKHERFINRRETRRHTTLGNSDDFGLEWATDPNSNIEDNFVPCAKTIRVRHAIEKLLPAQKDLLHRVFFCNQRPVDIARELGVGKNAISNRMKRIEEKLKRILEKP